MKSKFKTFKNPAIFPIECGSESGTAFFITEEHLLTARHILADTADNQEQVLLCVAKTHFVCDIVWIGDSNNCIDLAILKCNGYRCLQPLKLLTLPPDRKEIELTICGFPYEQGGGNNQFEIPVRVTNKVEGREYDVVTNPEMLIGFSSYKGFSGSPVLNQMGAAVGVVTDQMNSVLGYRSIYSISNILESAGFKYTNDWESDDLNQYGLGYAKQILEKQIRLSGDRYNPERHIEETDWIKDLEIFSSYEYHNEIEKSLREIEKKYIDYAATLPPKNQILDWNKAPYKSGNYIQLAFFLQRAEKIVNSDPRPEMRDFKHQLSQALPQIDDIINKYLFTQQSVLAIEGDAGCGKTHMVCRFALHHKSACYTYLIHGKQLVASENIETQICRLCGFPDSDLSALNNKMESVGKYGVIIIDAINECSSGVYWETRLESFGLVFKKYPFLKLIVTVRTGTVILPSQWKKKTLTGFEDVSNAVGVFFKSYNVPSFDWSIFRGDFKNPLFLKMFCESFRYFSYDLRKKPRQLDVYLAYIQERNIKLSELVDEDICRNITTKYLVKIASHSLFYEHCGDISREKARQISNTLSPNRGWRFSLLKNSLDENILISFSNYSDQYDATIGFHYDKMGDFLRAYALMQSKMNIERKIDWLVEQEQYVSKNDEHIGKFSGLIGAFVSIYDGAKNLLEYPAFFKGSLRKYLIYSLPYNTQYTGQIVKLLLQGTCPDLVRALINGFNDYSNDAIITLHKELCHMTLSQRDYIWSEAVNQYYDEYSYDFGRWKWELCEAADMESALVLLSWLLCSSYPDVRHKIIRQIFVILSKYPDYSEFIINVFKNCNDPYVIEGILCAVYGVVLESRNAEFVSSIARLVAEIYYSDERNIPTNIQIRKWSLKIFEKDKLLNSESILFDKYVPPFAGTYNPFDYLSSDDKAYENKDFFGKSKGSRRIWESVFGFEDFARYIIGTNNSSTSHNFIYKDKSELVPLSDIQEMVAQRIKEMGWSDELGVYDDNRYSPNRHENQKERLGKKYQWIAYRDIMGALCDFCRIKDGFEFTQPYTIYEKNYPWYTYEVDSFDPTLKERINNVGKIERDSPFGIKDKDGIKWVENDTEVPQIKIIYQDVEGVEWVCLYGYDSEDVNQGEYQIEGFLFFNSHIVKYKDKAKVTEWAADKNFYGRWLRETRDRFDFLWNEYPWSDSYKHSSDGVKWESLAPGNGCLVESMLSTINQLQEDSRGLDAEDYLSNAYAPCEDMINVLNLYTAERGIVKDIKTNEIVSCSLHQLGINHGGLAIKKSYLVEYLKKTDSVIFFFIMGEKLARRSTTVLGSGIKELSACWLIDKDNLCEIQPVRVVRQDPRSPIDTDGSVFDWLEEFIKHNPDVEMVETDESERE